MLCERYWPTSVLSNETKPDKRSNAQVETYENGILNGGYFEQNSGQRYVLPLKEALRQTMINHEAIFRNQVRELHRLYKVQQLLMNDLSWKEFERFTAWTESPQATPLSDNKARQHKQLVEENIFPQPRLSMMASTQTEKRDVFEGGKSFYSSRHKPQMRTFDLELSADEYFSTELVKAGNLKASVSDSLETKEFLFSKHVNDPEHYMKGGCKTSHSSKSTCSRIQHVIDLEEPIGTMFDGETKAVPLINFEAAATYAGAKHGSQLSAPSNLILSGRTRIDSDCTPPLKRSFADNSENSREFKSFDLNAGLNEQDDSSAVDVLAQKQQCTHFEAKNACHEQVQVDGSSFILHDSATMFPSLVPKSSIVSHEQTSEYHTGTHSSGTCARIPNNKCFNDNHVQLQDNALNSVSMDSMDQSFNLCSNVSQLSPFSSRQVPGQSSEYMRSTWIHDLNAPIDVKQLPEGQQEFHGCSGKQFLCRSGSSSLLPAGICKENAKNLSKGLPSGFLQSDCRKETLITDPISEMEENCIHPSFGSGKLQISGDAECRQVNSEKSEEDTLSSGQLGKHVVVHGSVSSPIEEKTSGNCDGCNIKDLESASENQRKVGHSNISTFEDSGTTQLESVVTETSSNKRDPISEYSVLGSLPDKSCEVKNQEHNEQQQGQAADTDTAVHRAAESLIQISLENAISYSSCFVNAGTVELETDERSDQPQYSSDSYESITLMLKESSMDEFSSSARPYEEKDMGRNASGLNLRRGRRMKDFQKDILPSLVSLSRHEICEDMNIIGGVISANGKNGGRRVRAETWGTPTRSRRARLYCIDRRY